MLSSSSKILSPLRPRYLLTTFVPARRGGGASGTSLTRSLLTPPRLVHFSDRCEILVPPPPPPPPPSTAFRAQPRTRGERIKKRYRCGGESLGWKAVTLNLDVIRDGRIRVISERNETSVFQRGDKTCPLERGKLDEN